MPSVRRKVSDSFFDHIREWSRRKHEALSGYVRPFTEILGKYFGPVYVIDGFAGRGYYGAGADREDGSPLRIAKLARDLKSRQLRCINVELMPEEFADLEEATRPYADIVENIHGRFADHVDGIIEKIGHAPAFFFIDPFALSGLTWETMTRIGGRNHTFKTELLVNFFAPYFNRDAGWLKTEHKAAAAFGRRLDRVMGHGDWRRIWDDASLDYEQRCEQIADMYCEGLERQFNFIASKYPIREHLDGRLKYYLIHATRNPLGRRIMSEVFYSVHRRYLELRAEKRAQDEAERAQRPGHQPPLMPEFLAPPSLEEIEKDYVSQLANDIHRLLMERGPKTLLQIYDELIRNWFGHFTATHYRAACTELRDAGKATWEGARLTPNTIVRLAD